MRQQPEQRPIRGRWLEWNCVVMPRVSVSSFLHLEVADLFPLLPGRASVLGDLNRDVLMSWKPARNPAPLESAASAYGAEGPDLLSECGLSHLPGRVNVQSILQRCPSQSN